MIHNTMQIMKLIIRQLNVISNNKLPRTSLLVLQKAASHLDSRFVDLPPTPWCAPLRPPPTVKETLPQKEQNKFRSRENHTIASCTNESVDSVCRDGTDMPYVTIQTKAWKSLLNNSYTYLTFTLECSITTKTFKVVSNHRRSTKLEFVKTAKLFVFFFFLLFQTGYLSTAASTRCSFSMNGQHFVVHRSTVSQNLRNFRKQGTSAAAFQLDAIFEVYAHAQN